MNDQQLLRYSRHILLPELDIIGQERILNSQIAVIGCGGLGSAAIPILAAAGVGKMVLIDNDTIELSNLQRQTPYCEEHLGKSKAIVLAEIIAKQNKEVKTQIVTERVNLHQLLEITKNCHVILDCSDNLATRQAINKVAVAHKIPLVFGAAIRFEGQFTVFDARQEYSPCYACLFEGDEQTQDTCSTSGIFSPLVNIIGAKQAMEALKLIAQIGTSPIGSLLNYDALNLNHYIMQFKRNPNCKVCGL